MIFRRKTFPKGTPSGQLSTFNYQLTSLLPFCMLNSAFCIITMDIRENVNLSLYNTFHTGGAAQFFAEVKTVEAAQEALLYAHKHQLPVLFLGGGSNVLFPDEGIKGLVIKNSINFIQSLDDTHLSVGAGVYTTSLAQHCLKLKLSGIEALFGLPGTVGGAIRGNAGTLGTEIKDVLVDVTLIDDNNQLQTYPASYFEFEYRESILKRIPHFVTHCTIALTPGDEALIQNKMIETKNWRKDKQPGGFTAGSYFKNPPGTSAGALIDQAGLRGFNLGPAQVSPKHANFLTNTGKATTKDVIMLAAHVKKIVLEKFGIELEEEVKIIYHS